MIKPPLAALCFALLPTGLVAQTAVLEPITEASIRTTVAGRIAEILVREGEEVAAGSPLVAIDAQVQAARVAVARVSAEGGAAVARAEAHLTQAESLANRVREARDRGAAQDWELDAANQAVTLAEADLALAIEAREQALAQLALEQATLAEFSILAPFDATVLEILLAPGEIADTQTVIMEIGALHRLAATVFVSPTTSIDWRTGTEISAQVGGQPVTAEVATIDPRLDPVSRTVRVRLEIDNEARGIAVGSSLEMSVGE